MMVNLSTWIITAVATCKWNDNRTRLKWESANVWVKGVCPILSHGSDERKLAEVSDNSSVVKLRENLRVQQKLLYSDDIKLVGKVCTVSKSDELQNPKFTYLLLRWRRQNDKIAVSVELRGWGSGLCRNQAFLEPSKTQNSLQKSMFVFLFPRDLASVACFRFIAYWRFSFRVEKFEILYFSAPKRCLVKFQINLKF